MAARGEKFKVNTGNNPTGEAGYYKSCVECSEHKTRVSAPYSLGRDVLTCALV